MWGGYNAATKAQFKKIAADLNEITIPGMIVIYSMYKKNDLEATIIQYFHMDYIYIAGVIRLAIIGGSSSHANAMNRSY